MLLLTVDPKKMSLLQFAYLCNTRSTSFLELSKSLSVFNGNCARHWFHCLISFASFKSSFLGLSAPKLRSLNWEQYRRRSCYLNERRYGETDSFNTIYIKYVYTGIDDDIDQRSNSHRLRKSVFYQWSPTIIKLT